MKCKECGSDNLQGTKFCQSCGASMKQKAKIDLSSIKYLAGMGTKGVSVAPVAIRKIEEDAKDLQQIVKKEFVKVVKLEDKSWYCPECGEHNKPYAVSCKGCGRDVNS